MGVGRAEVRAKQAHNYIKKILSSQGVEERGCGSFLFGSFFSVVY